MIKWSNFGIRRPVHVCTHSTVILNVFFSLAFSPDSSILASTSDDYTIRIWSVHDHTAIRTLNVPGVKTVAFSPDGQRVVATFFRKGIKLWGVEKWEMLAEFSETSGMTSVRLSSFSTDGTYIIVEFYDGYAKRWNIFPNAEYSSGHTAQSSYDDNNFFEHTASLFDEGRGSSKNVPLQMVLVPVPGKVDVVSHRDVGPYRHPYGSEWIIDQDNRRVCWIPANLRNCSDVHDKKVVFGGANGKIAILDLLDTLVS